MPSTDFIQKTADYVKKTLQEAEAGHDWWHTLRVWKNAKRIAQTEPCNRLVVELAALLHDIADTKFNNGDEEEAPRLAQAFLSSIGAESEMIEQVVNIIRHISFKNTFKNQSVIINPELAIVRDADRLDAIGAIGIARTFHYGGYKNRQMYNPSIPPQHYQSQDSYQKSDAPTINHFYEKLLKLKDQMLTNSGKKLAEERHAFMEKFLQQFFSEWEGL